MIQQPRHKEVCRRHGRKIFTEGVEVMTKKVTMRSIAIICAVFLTAAMLSCGGGGSVASSGGKSSVTLSITGLKAGAVSSASVPANVASIKFIISGDGMDTIEQTVSAAGQDTIVQTFEVSNGLHRHFLVEAFASNGSTILYQGDQFADLDGTPKDISILMGFDISGPWTFTIGSGSALFTFAQTGNSLTFSATLPGGAGLAASSKRSATAVTCTGSGTINGDDLELTGTCTVDCGTSNLTVTGTVSDDGHSIDGTLTESGCSGTETFSFSAEQGTVPQVDITGSWSLFHTKQGGTEQGPDLGTFTQSGNSVTFSFIETNGTTTQTGSGTINGNSVQLIKNADDTNSCGNPNAVSLTGTISADGNTITGTYTDAGAGLGNCGDTGTWRASRAQPPAFDLSGGWSGFHTPQGGTEQGPDCVTITQTGNFFAFSGSSTGAGVISGNIIQFSFEDNSSNCTTVTSLSGTVTNANSANGTYTAAGSGSGCSGSPESGTWRLVKGACTSTSPVDVVITLP